MKLCKKIQERIPAGSDSTHNLERDGRKKLKKQGSEGHKMAGSSLYLARLLLLSTCSIKEPQDTSCLARSVVIIRTDVMRIKR